MRVLRIYFIFHTSIFLACEYLFSRFLLLLHILWMTGDPPILWRLRKAQEILPPAFALAVKGRGPVAELCISGGVKLL